MNNNKWMLRELEWYPQDGGIKYRGMQSTRWRDKEWLAGNYWLATAEDKVAWHKFQLNAGA